MALRQRWAELGEAGLRSLFDRATLDNADRLAWTIATSPPPQAFAAIERRFGEQGLVETWKDLAGLHAPPGVLIQVRERHVKALPALKLLVALSEASPAWPVMLACEDRGLRDSLHTEPDTHAKAVLRAGVIESSVSDSAGPTPAPRPEAHGEEVATSFVPVGGLDPVERARRMLEGLGLPNEQSDGGRSRQAVGGEATRPELPPGAARARSQAELALYYLLEAQPETRGLFQLNVLMPFTFGSRPAELDLFSKDLALCVEVDGPHHFLGACEYRRDRRKDALLQGNEICVIRVLAEDVSRRQEEVLDFILDNVRKRRRGR